LVIPQRVQRILAEVKTLRAQPGIAIVEVLFPDLILENFAVRSALQLIVEAFVAFHLLPFGAHVLFLSLDR
jgi:hypothetical protein